MGEQDTMEALAPVLDINHRFTVRKDFLVGIGTSAIDIFVADMATLAVDTLAVSIGTLVVGTGEGVIDTSVLDNGEAAIATDENEINIKRAT